MTKEIENNWTSDITDDFIAGVRPKDGSGFKRVPFGDYKVRITDADQKTKEGTNPHVMLVITYTILEARDPANKDAVGMEVVERYAGSRQSPKFMQERLAHLIKSLGLKLGKEGLSRKMLIGRDLDITVTWELGKEKFDEQTGDSKRYVNLRILAERPAGTTRPAGVNPAVDSRAAATYLEEKYGDTVAATPSFSAPEAAASSSIPPWEAPKEESDTTIKVSPTWRADSEGDDTMHLYRAYIILKTPYAAQAREMLIASGFDPDGKVDASRLPENVRKSYLDTLPEQLPLDLPPATSNGRKGTRSKHV